MKTKPITQREAIKRMLYSNEGKRVSVMDISRAFKEAEQRKWIAQYNARIHELRKEILGTNLIISNKTKFVEGQKHSWYMLHRSSDNLHEKKPLPTN